MFKSRKPVLGCIAFGALLLAGCNTPKEPTVKEMKSVIEKHLSFQIFNLEKIACEKMESKAGFSCDVEYEYLERDFCQRMRCNPNDTTKRKRSTSYRFVQKEDSSWVIR